MALVQARTLLNQAGMNVLHESDPAQQKNELRVKIEDKILLAQNAITEFNQKLLPYEAQSNFTKELNLRYQQYSSTLSSLVKDLDQDDISSFMKKPVQKHQDDLEKASENWLIDCDRLVKSGEKANHKAYKRSMELLIILIIVLPCIVYFVWQQLQRLLIRPLKSGIKHIHSIAGGN